MQEIQLIIVHKDNYQIYYRLLYMRINLLFKKKSQKIWFLMVYIQLILILLFHYL